MKYRSKSLSLGGNVIRPNGRIWENPSPENDRRARSVAESAVMRIIDREGRLTEVRNERNVRGPDGRRLRARVGDGNFRCKAWRSARDSPVFLAIVIGGFFVPEILGLFLGKYGFAWTGKSLDKKRVGVHTHTHTHQVCCALERVYCVNAEGANSPCFALAPFARRSCTLGASRYSRANN